MRKKILTCGNSTLSTDINEATFNVCGTYFILDEDVSVLMDFLIDGKISSFCPDQHGGEAFNPNNATQTQSIFAKL